MAYLRPGEPASSSDDSMGPNARAWQSMFNNIFTTVTQCRVVNESDVISDLAALAVAASNQTVASGYLKDVSPKDARLLEGVSSFSLRSMLCPGEPEANFVFAGDSSIRKTNLLPDAMWASTSRKNPISFQGVPRMLGTLSNGAEDFPTSSRMLSSLWTTSSGGEPLAWQLLSSRTLVWTRIWIAS